MASDEYAKPLYDMHPQPLDRIRQVFFAEVNRRSYRLALNSLVIDTVEKLDSGKVKLATSTRRSRLPENLPAIDLACIPSEAFYGDVRF